MIQNWNIGLPYAFSPFSIISRVLLKTKQECVPLLILIAPVWSTQPWYPEVLNLCVREPVLLPQRQKNLKSPKNIVHPLMLENSLTLAAWLVSGKPSCVKEFQKTLLTLSQIPDEKAHSLIMSTWRKWASWCLERKIDPFQAPVKDIIEYLTFFFNYGSEYRERSICIGQQFLSSINILVVCLQENTLRLAHWYLVYLI